ncbi:hypothetical protein NDN08_006749 [Rhodosorus marinus]|uniref:PB1 domain-containing protein n=1 Tax=Rhodosorus marinus TaxID=101924 RepID=A0AAV8UM41_9RHOD|nr:hypothetical protein NDN08_006749 [Rhodosorus marinus]
MGVRGPVPVKVRYGGDVRRFRLNAGQCSYEELQKRLVELYKPSFKEFIIQYKDDEGDMVRVTSEDEFVEAVIVSKAELQRGQDGGLLTMEALAVDEGKKRSSRGPMPGGMPSFTEFFSGMPQGSFMHFFPGGRFINPIVKSIQAVPEPVKNRFKDAAMHIFDSGQMENFMAIAPKILENMRGFTEENLSLESQIEQDLDSAKVDTLIENLRAVMQDSIAEPNVNEILDAVRAGLKEKPARRLLFVAHRRFQWATEGEAFRMREKEWENEEGFEGEIVPKAPLKRGDEGPKVLHLQSCLIKLGKLKYENIRWRAGFFGPRTMAAIKTLQEEQNLQLEVAGSYDEITAAALKTLVENMPTEAEQSKETEESTAEFDLSNIFWLMSSFSPFLGGFRRPGYGVQQGRPGPWMAGGMPFGPHMMHRFQKAMESVSDDTRQAIEEAAKSVWVNGQMQAAFTSGPQVFPLMKKFVRDTLGAEANAEEGIAAEKIDSFEQDLKVELDQAGLSEDSVQKILAAVKKALGEVSVRKHLQEMNKRKMARRMGPMGMLKQKPWEKDENFEGETTPKAPLEKGSSGNKVMHLQAMLVEVGKMVPANMRHRVGFYGKYTEAGVKKLQEECGLADSVESLGLYDAVTAATLASLVEAKREGEAAKAAAPEAPATPQTA